MYTLPVATAACNVYFNVLDSTIKAEIAAAAIVAAVVVKADSAQQ
jgi:hypothetical protein